MDTAPTSNTLDKDKTSKFVEENFEDLFIKPLSDFIRIPNLSPDFDEEFLTNGFIQKAINLVKEFAESLHIEGIEFNCYSEESKPPMVVITYNGNPAKNVMFYGHLDKQPHMEPWQEGLGPTSPVIIDNKLYGRGSNDDGYASFALLLAMKNALEQGAQLPRITLVLETEEESGSDYLEYLLNKCLDWIGKPDICICLDSGVLDYSTLWLTSSLRGCVTFNMKVTTSANGVHSGSGGGIVPESFRVVNTLLDRIEDPVTRRIKFLEVDIPQAYIDESKEVMEIVGDKLHQDMGLSAGCIPFNHNNLPEMYLNNTWRPALAVTGAEGFPPLSKAGNVLRPYTAIRCVVRLPPSKDPKEAYNEISKLLTEDPPYGATVELSGVGCGGGFFMKNLSGSNTIKALDDASNAFFGKNTKSYGDGGSIPFLKLLGEMFESAEIIAIGVAGNECNQHLPNEFLNLSYAKEFICVLSHALVGFAPT